MASSKARNKKNSRRRSAPPSPAVTISSEDVANALGSIHLGPEELERLIASLQLPSQSVLRLRRGVEPSDLPMQTQPIPWYRLARRAVDSELKPSRIMSYFAGDYYLQDAGSLLALAACGADNDLINTPMTESTGLLVCDLCAAPGGKASALLEAIGENDFLLANEPIRSRIAPLSYNLARVGSDRYAISSLDPEGLADRIGGVFDLVVVDAPCSGQALMAKGRQSASALSSRQIQHSAARQARILDAATRLLRESGRLVYSTCTFAEAENESQVSRLVETGSFRPVPVPRLQDYASKEVSACYRLWPHRHDCAGGFAASMEATSSRNVPRRWKSRQGEKPPIDPSVWFECSNQTRFQTIGSVLLGWPEDAPPWIEEIATSGPEFAHRTGQTWKPAHAAALRRGSSAIAKQRVDVDFPTAVEFLQGNPIRCDDSGWQVVCAYGRPLGWIKGTSNVGKNQLFPAARSNGPIEG